MSTIILLAGGPSVAEYDITDLHKRGDVIGVNQSFINYDGCLAGITMDRLWMEANIDLILEKKKPFFVRHAAVKNLADKIKESPYIRLFDCFNTHEMQYEPDKINGTSSGMCALNLALQLNPKIIYLLGYDMGATSRPYWHAPYAWAKNGATKPGKYKEWAQQFDEISSKIKARIVNVNHQSALRCFPTITYKEFCRDTKAR